MTKRVVVGMAIGVGFIVVLIAAYAELQSRMLIRDTFRDLYPDTVDYTAFKLRVLRERAERFRERHGRLPDSIGEIDPIAENVRDREGLRYDGWGNPIRFIRDSGSKSYEFRSPGPDARDGTSDDVLVQSEGGAPSN